jgi:16S rRNA C967 or C1407 C5-methylase (RsmB/RsmF family)
VNSGIDVPSKLLVKLSQSLFKADALQQSQFINCLVHPQPYPAAILWCQAIPEPPPFSLEPALSWQPAFIDRLELGSKPGQHPLHDQGAYYCLDFSSVFAASVVQAIAKPVDVILDLCAAPGGKGIFAWRSLQPKLLIANEAIGKRMGMLMSNLTRCGIRPAIAANFDPSVLATQLPQAADLVLVDAPCSGQSLLAKGGKAPGCFHPVSINKNANRQKRILANAAQLVAPQGYLAYMTCTYSSEENEQVCAWFLERFPDFAAVAVEHLASFQSHLTDLPCYRMWPHDHLGAGAFTCLFQQRQQGSRQEISPDFLEQRGVRSLLREGHL